MKLPIHHSWREGEVDDDEDGPHGAEELERILRRSIAKERSGNYTLLVCAIGVLYAGSRRTVASEAQDDDSEDELDGAKAKGDDFEHAWGGNCTKRKWQSVSEV